MGAKLDGKIHSEDVLNVNQNIKVLAGPGAGKTYWLIGHIKYILSTAEDLGLYKKVGCITYTNKATENILSEIGYNNDRLEVSTIHAFLYRNVIKPFFHLIAASEGFAIDKLDGHDDTIISSYGFVSELMKANRMGMLLKHANESYKLKQTIEDFRWSLTTSDIELVNSNKFPRIKGVGIKYVQAYKKKVWSEYGIMHHDDVLYFTFKLITHYPRILFLLCAKFPYLLIDEYQDSSSIQHWLFMKLASTGCKVTLIGDQAQSIYTFAGSDIKNIEKFSAPNMKTFAIEDNHRSVQCVVDFLNLLRPNFTQKSLRTDKYEKVTILCGDSVVAYRYAKAISSEEELFALTWKNEDANTMKLGICASGKTEKLLEHLSEYDSNSDRRRAVANIVKGVENARMLLMDDAVKFIAKGFKLNLKHIDQKKLAIINLNLLLKKYNDYCDGDLRGLLSVVRGMDNNLSDVRSGKVFTAYQKPYKDYAKSVSYTDDNTNFITIHKAKGLGFENVLLVIPDKSVALNFLLNTNLDMNSDEHRTYYVACSRARKRLFINVPLLEDNEKVDLAARFGEIIKIEDVN